MFIYSKLNAPITNTPCAVNLTASHARRHRLAGKPAIHCLARRRTALRLPLLALSLLLLFSLPGLGQAAGIQSLSSIRETARAYVLEQVSRQSGEVKVVAGRLDPRLRLAACGHALTGFLPAGSRRIGAITVGVRCDGQVPWTLYVPVTVHVYGPIVVAARTLPRGTILQAGDLKTERRDLSRAIPGYLGNLKNALGMVLLRPLAPGNVLNESAVKPRQLVRRGERVTIVAQLNGLVVRSAGTALTNGAYGQMIRVRNTSSKRIIDAIVDAPGIVKISL